MISKSEELFKESFKVKRKLPLSEAIMALLYINFYAFIFSFVLEIDDNYITTGFWGIFGMGVYYIGAYFEKEKHYNLAGVFDMFIIAHSYLIICKLFDVSELYYVNLFFIVFSFFRAIYINHSSHYPQFLLFLIFGINHYIITAQSQIPLSELSIVNLVFCLILIISFYIMDLSKEVNKSTIGFGNLLLSAYLISVSYVITQENFEGEVVNYSLCILTLLAYLFWKLFKSKSYAFTFFLGSGALIIGQLKQINYDSLLNINISLPTVFKPSSEVIEDIIPEVVPEVIPEIQPEVIEETAKFGFSDIHPMFYLSPIIIILGFFIIKIIYNFMEKRASTKEDQERLSMEAEAAIIKETVEEAKEVIKYPVEVTGYYDPKDEAEKLRLETIKEDARKKAQEEKDFMNPFNLLSNEKDKDDDLFL